MGGWVGGWDVYLVELVEEGDGLDDHIVGAAGVELDLGGGWVGGWVGREEGGWLGGELYIRVFSSK